MNKRQQQGCILAVLGIILILSALLLHLADEKQDELAGETAEVLMQQLELSRVPLAQAPAEPQEEQTEDPKPADTQRKMDTLNYMGYEMIGTLRIPAVGIELPILNQWSYELLDVAPCRYTGSVYEETMILMGHKYKRHFAPLQKIEIGDTVEFEDVNGMTYRYVVSEVETLWKNDGESLPSEHPLILFTCTPGGQKRIVVRCCADEQEDLP